MPTGKPVAIKKLHNIFQNAQDAKRCLREIQILRSMPRHPNVVKVYDVIEPTESSMTFKELYFVFEYQKLDLAKMMNAGVKLQEMNVKIMMFNLLCGLNFIHSAGVVHRDIKPANILCNEYCQAILADFGLARQTAGLMDTEFLCPLDSASA